MSVTRQMDSKDSGSYVLRVKRRFFSNNEISLGHLLPIRKVQSERILHSKTSYDDLCGDWQFPENPTHTKHITQQFPVLYSWRFITQHDVSYMKECQYDKNSVLELIGVKLSNEGLLVGRNKSVFLKLIWETLIFAREHMFTDESMSMIIGLIFAVHSFFSSSTWRTAKEVSIFFRNSVFLHSVLVCIHFFVKLIFFWIFSANQIFRIHQKVKKFLLRTNVALFLNYFINYIWKIWYF